jgi:hypothetical protein
LHDKRVTYFCATPNIMVAHYLVDMMIYKKNISPTNVLIFSNSFSPSIVLCVIRPLMELEKKGEVSLKIHSSIFPQKMLTRDINWCDMAVFCRNMEPVDLTYLYELKRNNKKIIYEIDDNFEEIPINTPEGVRGRAVHRLHVLRRFYALADVVRVYSQRLKFLAEQQGAKTLIVKSYFDSTLIQNSSRVKNNKVIRLVYPTARLDDAHLEIIFYSALQQILKQYGNKIELHLWRCSVPEQLQTLPNVFLHKATSNYEKFIAYFYAQSFDIGLAPLLDEPFFQSKTNNKYREFAGCQIAGIYSDTLPYNDSVVHNSTGILVKNTIESWVSAMTCLIEDASLREKIAKNAEQDVLTNYTLQEAVNTYRQCIDDIRQQPTKPCSWTYDSSRQLSVLYIKNMLESDKKHCSQQLEIAIQLLRGRLRTLDLYYAVKNLTIFYKNTVVFFSIFNLSDLENYAIFFSSCRSILLDLSWFNGEAHDFINSYQILNLLKAVSFILTPEQKDLIEFAIKVNIPYSLVNAKLTALDESFSLKGYRGAYLDILEKHIQYSWGDAKVVSLFVRVKNYASYHLNRVKRISFVLLWRLGYRVT